MQAKACLKERVWEWFPFFRTFRFRLSLSWGRETHQTQIPLKCWGGELTCGGKYYGFEFFYLSS